MKALIVAAGMGLRLGGLTDETPKPVLDVGGVSLIQRSVGILNSYGISDISLVVGFRQERIRRLLGDSVSYIVNEDFATTNNMASMSLGRPSVDGYPFLYLHSDLWYDPRIIGVALDHPGDICLLVEHKACGEEEMKVRVENGLVVEADKGIPSDEAAGEWLGIIKFKPAGGSAFFDAVEAALLQCKTLYDCAVVQTLAAAGTAIHPVDVGRLPWVEIDFPDDLEHARELAGAAAG